MKKANNAEKGTNIEVNKDNKFLQLPNDILLSIFSFFNKKDLARTALTCKQLNGLVKNPALQNLPWPPLDYSLPPVQCNKVIRFKADSMGFGAIFPHLELLPNSYFAVMKLNIYKNWENVQIWDLATGQHVKSFAVTDDNFITFIVGLSKTCFLTVEDCYHRALFGKNEDITSIIKLWNIASDHYLKEIKIEKKITAVARVSDHCLAIATNTAIHLWNLTSGECIKTLDHGGSNIRKLLVILEKGYLISGGDSNWDKTENIIKIWDINKGELVKAFNSGESISDLTLASNNLLVSLEDNNIKLWNIETAKCINEFPVKDGLFLIALSKDYVVTAGYKNSLKIWELKEGKCVKNLGGTSLVLSSSGECALPKRLPDGNMVSYYASSDFDKSIRIWKFPELKLENNEITENKNESISKCSLQ